MGSSQFKFFKSHHVPSLTVLKAAIEDFSYDRHAHEEYAFGVTLAGRQDFFSGGQFHRSPPGNVILFNPEEVHDGHSGGAMVATLQFPAEGIQGMSLFIWALGLAALAAGAPGSYVVIGSLLGQRVRQPMLIKGFNWVMSGLLVAVAVSIGHEHVWLVVTARN